MKKLFCVFILLKLVTPALAQDPSFAQFFSSPLNVNPALTGNINADWRMIANFRDQWVGPASPFVTSTISYDRKILQERLPGTAEKRTFGVGGMLMYDHAMVGVQKSTYASLNMAYSTLVADRETKQYVGVGFGAIYGRRFVDFSKLDFEEQFVGTGFNTNLPTGEAALSNMKPYFSASAGITYSIKNDRSNFDAGIAGFHLNKPRQTFLEDDKQVVPIRKVAHANFETFLNNWTVLNVNAIYQSQLSAKYYSVGAALGYYTGGEEDVILNGGLWYWSNNALIPYVGLMYKDLQIGVSYDWTVSKLRQANPRTKSFEVSIILRGSKDPSGIIPCPWK